MKKFVPRSEEIQVWKNPSFQKFRYGAYAGGNRGRGRPPLRWKHPVETAKQLKEGNNVALLLIRL